MVLSESNCLGFKIPISFIERSVKGLKSLDIVHLLSYYLHSLSLLNASFIQYHNFDTSRFDQLKEQVLVYDYSCSLSDPFLIEALTT